MESGMMATNNDTVMYSLPYKYFGYFKRRIIKSI